MRLTAVAKSDRKQQTKIESLQFTIGEYMELGHAGGIHRFDCPHAMTVVVILLVAVVIYSHHVSFL